MSKNILINHAREEADIRSGIRIGMSYEVEVRDRNGKLLSSCKGNNDPFVRNWIRMIRTMFTLAESVATTSVNLNGTGGSGILFYASHASQTMSPMGCNAGATVETSGIRVGSSDTAFDKAQYELQTRITHGSGSGQLMYGASTVEDYSDEDTTTRFRILRPFTNSSGATITVKEIGIAICNIVTGTSTSRFLICRDVLTSPQSIPNLATLTVTYRLYISYA